MLGLLLGADKNPLFRLVAANPPTVLAGGLSDPANETESIRAEERWRLLRYGPSRLTLSG